MPNQKKQYCPNCNKQVNVYARYPKYICKDCVKLLTDKSGRLVAYGNEREDTISFGHGCQGYYQDNTTENYNSNISYINQSSYEAQEARFGGIVVQLKEKYEPDLTVTNKNITKDNQQKNTLSESSTPSINKDVIAKYLEYFIDFIFCYDEVDRLNMAIENLSYDPNTNNSIEDYVKELFSNDDSSLIDFIMEYSEKDEFGVCSYYNDFVVNYYEGINSENYGPYEHVLAYSGTASIKLIATENIIWILTINGDINEVNSLCISSDGLSIRDAVLESAAVDHLEISEIDNIPKFFIKDFEDINKLLLSFF